MALMGSAGECGPVRACAPLYLRTAARCDSVHGEAIVMVVVVAVVLLLAALAGVALGLTLLNRR